MTIDTNRILGSMWRDAPAIVDVMTRHERLPMADDRLLRKGAIGLAKGILGRAAARRRCLDLLEALFRTGQPMSDLSEMPVTAILEEEDINLFILLPNANVLWFTGMEHFDVPGVTVWAAGYRSGSEWLWSSLNRTEHIRAASIGSCHFMRNAMKPLRMAA